ncbi:MAG: hypothetical protein KJ698_12785 [Actinobacteria bacterium]|nr:hypothetical protein [Actinomycetota bacterium]MBU1494644.1 hypothetical protein [Actinomycetota bacterium]MBU1866041.1 hypothetical protein [Actinomycetota bacterium]
MLTEGSAPPRLPGRQTAAVALLVFALSIGSTVPAGASTARTVSGTVACLFGKPVVAVWVESTRGDSGWASWERRTGAPWIADYSIKITTATASTRVRLHVGCGGDPEAWWSDNRTPFERVSRSKVLDAQCRERAGTGRRCAWWGRTALVGMPFTGWWDRFGLAHPRFHGTSTGNWATDLYERAGTKVRAHVWAPRKADLRLEVASVTSSTACPSSGRQVKIDVYLGSSKIGWVAYVHLASVRAGVVPGATIDPGAVVGELARWPYSSCWQVTSDTGIHTHHAEYNYHGYSCYAPRESGARIGRGRWIGSLGATTASGNKQACR